MDLSSCATPSSDEVRRLLALELRDRLVPEAAVAPDDARHVRVVCEAGSARLRLPEAADERAVALESVEPELRARVLALSIAELLQQAIAPAVDPAPPESVPVAEPAKKPAPVAAVSRVASPRFALWAGPELAATPLFAYGGAAQLRARLAPWFVWASALSFTQGRREIDRGALRVQSVALRTGPAFLYERGRAALLAGLGARAGLWLLRGEPDDETATVSANFRSAYLGPALFTGGSVRFGEHTLIALELELAHTMRRVKADVIGGGASTLSAWRSSLVLGVGATW